MTTREAVMRVNDLSIDRNAEGAWRIAAIVKDNATPFAWYETKVFYGYTRAEAVRRYREVCQEQGLVLVKD